MNVISDLPVRKQFVRAHFPFLLAAIVAILGDTGSASAQKCDPLPANAVSWWPGENNALDDLGNNNGTFEGTPTYATGEVGNAFSFNGASRYVRVPNSPSLQISSGLTLEAWVYPLSYNPGSSSSVMCEWDAIGGINQRAWSFGIDGPGPGFFGVSADGLNGTYAYTTTHIPLNAWTHLAATYDGNNLVIYFNGSAQASTPFSSGIISSTDDVGIGATIGGGGPIAIFNGLIDEPTIYNRALSAAEIQAIYNAGSAGKCPDFPPVINTQPTDQIVEAGSWATFNVAASGSQPLAYQWQFNGTNLSGATNASLVLPYVQLNQTGNYDVIVSNGAGSPVTSRNAYLTVLPSPPCDPAPSNIVSWWAGENNALDNYGINNGTLVGSPAFSSGEVGEAFSFNGTNQFVRISNSPSLHITNALTLEAWIYPLSYNPGSSSSVLCQWDAVTGPNQRAWSFGVDGPGPGFFGVSPDGINGTFAYTSTSCPLNAWTHLAATYDGNNLIIYFNGSAQGSASLAGGIFNGTDNIGIGATIGGGGPNALFNGLIDEPAVYNRALSASEIQAIYNAGAGGKCPFAPSIIAQPASQNVFAGTTASFSAVSSGSQPVTYQWQYNGSPIPGATNLSLTLSNVFVTNDGNYSLLVSNSLNSALSSNAALNVLLVTVLGNGKPLTNSQYTFTNSVTIQLTNYFANGDIFYTLNGTTPTAGSTLYTGSFILTNNAVIQALGYSSDFQISALSPPVSILIPPVYAFSATTLGGGHITFSPANTNDIGNTLVTLTATPSNGWTFLQWLGDAGGTNVSNSVIVDRNKSVEAVFGTTVSNVVGGNGSVVFNPPGGVYPYGTILQAAAIPQSGSFFVLWGDSATGNTNPLSFSVTNASPTISALFTTLGVGEVALAVVPVGHGTVSINPQANSYASGSSVTITATPGAGHAFIGWSGGASGTNNPLTLQLNASETIYANFTTNNSLVIYPVTPPGVADGMAVDLLGEPGTHYRLDASTSLTNWNALYNLTNSVGTLHYIDLGATNLPRRFYRTVILP